MRIIRKGNATVIAVCGRQNNIEGRTMRPSVFMLKSQNEDGLLLYHTLTGELLLLDEHESLDEETVRTALAEKWFYVPEDFDECRFSEQVRAVAELLAPKPDALTDFTIFTTTDCNARCFYCYEKGARRLSMSEQTAHDTAAFIISSCKGQKVGLHWFGGEPLYNSRVIDIIIRDLADAGVKYDSKMISNGYLFDEETVKKAKDLWKLKEVQISLDGTEKIYNRTKNYIYENNSAYEKVLENIRKLLDAGISVHVRLNLNSANFDDLMRLADELKERFEDVSGLHVYAALLYDYVGTGNGFAGRTEAFAKQKELKDKLLRLGISKTKCLKEEYRINQCMASNDHGVTILPDGHLGKCEHDIDDGWIGSIYEGITDTALVKAWKERKPPGTLCKTCPAFPMCSVLIRKCPSNQKDCTPEYRDGFIELLKEEMQNTYTEMECGK